MKDEEDFIDAEIVNETITKDILSKIQWRTKDRRYIYVKDMEDKHLRNSALFLMGLGYEKCVTTEPVRIAWLKIFRMEWERRMIEAANGNKKFRVYPDFLTEIRKEIKK